MSAAQRAGQRSAAAAKAEPAGPDAVSRRLEKSAAAFRTISEVAEELDVPQHVLRFWESKFPQVRPLKRGGGRRYYRPEDVDLLGRIRKLLYEDGYTIKGVQRLMREGALRAKRDAAADADEGEADAAPEAAAGAAGGAGRAAPSALAGEARGELEGLLADLVGLRDELRRFAG